MSTGDHRPDPPYAAPPKEMLASFLDFHRATLLWKIEELSDEEVRRPLTASGVCLLAIVKHSAMVERWWFQIGFAGLDVPKGWSKEDPNSDWRIESHETTEQIVELYETECARSREIIARAAWDDLAKQPGRRPGLTFGWILTHMVEEVARHNGQADILREMIDGATGE